MIEIFSLKLLSFCALLLLYFKKTFGRDLVLTIKVVQAFETNLESAVVPVDKSNFFRLYEIGMGLKLDNWSIIKKKCVLSMYRFWFSPKAAFPSLFSQLAIRTGSKLLYP